MIHKTALYDWHLAHQAKMVDFAGWSMPIQYGSIVAEHVAARTAAVLFDVSHMGRFAFEGGSVSDELDRLLTRRVKDLAEGRIRYGLVTNEQGGVLDDVLVYRLPSPYASGFSMVVNAGNRDKILHWIRGHAPSLHVIDRTLETAMIAVQGPRSIELVDAFLDTDLPELGYYQGAVCKFSDIQVTCSRTGYTGEDGCELIVPAERATDVWQTLWDAGQRIGVVPAGLGARDTLRLEAGMPLYGHELTEQVNPYQAGLSFAVNLKDRDFIGRDALVRARQDATAPRRVGLRLGGKRVPREHHEIRAGEKRIGTVTSGTFSPTLGIPLAMGYVAPDYADAGMQVAIDIRGRLEQATVSKLPFYTRA